MILYKVVNDGSDEGGHWSDSYIYSTFEKAIEKFERIYNNIIYDVNANKADDDEPDMEKTLTHFHVYAESMGYYSESIDIVKEEVDSGMASVIGDDEAKRLLKKEKREPEAIWPGMEVESDGYK